MLLLRDHRRALPPCAGPVPSTYAPAAKRPAPVPTVAGRASISRPNSWPIMTVANPGTSGLSSARLRPLDDPCPGTWNPTQPPTIRVGWLPMSWFGPCHTSTSVSCSGGSGSHRRADAHSDGTLQIPVGQVAPFITMDRRPSAMLCLVFAVHLTPWAPRLWGHC